MSGYVIKMNTLVSNINRRGLKDYRSKPATKAYANRCNSWLRMKI